VERHGGEAVERGRCDRRRGGFVVDHEEYQAAAAAAGQQQIKVGALLVLVVDLYDRNGMAEEHLCSGWWR
jgi:hypothetical protein